MCKSMTIYSPVSSHYTTYCIMLVEVWGIEPQLLLVTLSRKTISLTLSRPSLRTTSNPIIPLHIEGSSPPKLEVVQ